MKIIALNAGDLIKAVDSISDSRSRSCSSSLSRFNKDKGILDFVTRCSGSKNNWSQRIKIDDWDLLEEEAFELSNWNDFLHNYPEIKDMDVKVSCNCPSHLYWGSAYSVDQMDAGELTLKRYKNSPAPETRAPNIRDPGNDHILCKHLISVIRKFFV